MILQPSWGPGVYVSMATIGLPSHATLEDHPLDAFRKPFALMGWIFETLQCDPERKRAFLQIFATEGRGVHICWEHSKPKGPEWKGRGVGLCWATSNPKGPKD